MRIQDLVSGSQSEAELFVNAVCEQARFTEGLPRVLSYAPLAQINPFQRLLYCRAAQAGYAVVPTVHFESLAPVNWGGQAVIHLHWLASVLAGVQTENEAKSNIDAFEKEMIRWRNSGHKIVWTMHNILPHNTVFPDAEIALRRVMVRYSDCIHILAESSVEEARQYFEIPEAKVFCVPHPSYDGWYANVNDSQNARLDLGIESDAFTFVQFGALQRYKGVLELINAFRQLQKKYPSRVFRLVVAGNPADKQYVAEVLDAISDCSQVRLIQSAMQEKEIQTLFNAADVVVAPYVKTLNSGVALLAATFRKSLIAPNIGGVGETFKEDTTLLYNPEQSESLLEAMECSLTYRVPCKVFDAILDTYRPDVISARFFEALTNRLFPLHSALQKAEKDG